MTPSEAKAEARRRIAAAKESGATLLDLGNLGLAEIPAEIASLGELRTLALGKMRPNSGDAGTDWVWDGERPEPILTSVEPLRRLCLLSSLSLSGCKQLTSVEPLRELRQLAKLGLSGCEDLTSVEPL